MLAYAAIPPSIHAASIGIPDTLLLMLLALMVFGPRRLPEIGRQIGKLMYEFRKISNDFKFQMEEELRLSEEADRQRQLAATQATHTPPPAPDFVTAALPTVTEPSADTATEIAAVDSVAADPAPADSALQTDQPVAQPVSQSVTSAIPTIHPPTRGGVVPRAFRGLVPPSVAAPESAVEQIAAPEPAQRQTEVAAGLPTQATPPEPQTTLSSPEANG